jgi:Fur family zinc uptake transcriptional regulator
MKDIIAQAARYCADHGHRFTAPRENVLAIVTGAQKPLSAYQIIEKMPDGTQPPTVYRALEFWESEGFIHRIGSIGLYAACHAGHRHNGAQFMVCDECGGVEEAHLCDLPPDLAALADNSRFTVARWNLELHGTCRNCATG